MRSERRSQPLPTRRGRLRSRAGDGAVFGNEFGGGGPELDPVIVAFELSDPCCNRLRRGVILRVDDIDRGVVPEVVSTAGHRHSVPRARASSDQRSSPTLRNDRAEAARLRPTHTSPVQDSGGFCDPNFRAVSPTVLMLVGKRPNSRSPILPTGLGGALDPRVGALPSTTDTAAPQRQLEAPVRASSKCNASHSPTSRVTNALSKRIVEE